MLNNERIFNAKNNKINTIYRDSLKSYKFIITDLNI
jgi:hypothetical protein